MGNKNAGLGEHDVFQEYYDLINKYVSLGSEVNKGLRHLKKDIVSIESQLENTIFRQKDFWNHFYYRKLEEILRIFLIIFKIRGFYEDVLFASFRFYTRYIKFLTKESASVISPSELAANFKTLLPNNFFEIEINPEYEFMISTPENYYSIDKIEDSFQEKLSVNRNFGRYVVKRTEPFKVFCDNYIAKEIQWNQKKFEFTVINEFHYMTIDMAYERGKKRIEYPEAFALSFLHITTGLKSIDGCELDIEDLKKGSIWVKFKLWMKGIDSKEEVKQVLDRSKKAVISGDTKTRRWKREEVRKRRKLTKEENLSSNLLRLEQNKEDISRSKEYKLELERLKVEEQRLLNLEHRLRIAKSAQEMIESGIVSAEELEIWINSNAYLSKKHGRIYGSQDSIDDIT